VLHPQLWIRGSRLRLPSCDWEGIACHQRHTACVWKMRNLLHRRGGIKDLLLTYNHDNLHMKKDYFHLCNLSSSQQSAASRLRTLADTFVTSIKTEVANTVPAGTWSPAGTTWITRKACSKNSQHWAPSKKQKQKNVHYARALGPWGGCCAGFLTLHGNVSLKDGQDYSQWGELTVNDELT